MLKYYVCKKDGTKELVPEIVANAIFEAKTPKIKWQSKAGVRMIDLSLISELLTEEEYYQKHPEERPARTEELKELPPPKKYTRAEAISALNSMIKGLNNHLKNNPNSYKAKALLEKMVERKNLAEKGDVNLETIKDLINFNKK